MLRGFHSKSRSSTASSTAATGEAKVADMPAAAPATRSVFRSAAVSSKNWATRDPKAPPVMMIGPSAPNGPPLPIEIGNLRLGLRRQAPAVGEHTIEVLTELGLEKAEIDALRRRGIIAMPASAS